MGNCLNKSRRQVQPSITVEARISASNVKRESKKIFNFRKYSARVDVPNVERETDKDISASDAIVIEDLSDQHLSDSVLVSVCSHSVLQEVKHIENVDTPNSLATQQGSPYYASNESIYDEFTDAGGKVEEEIDEHEDDGMVYLPNAVRVSPNEDKHGLGEVGSGKVLLDINQIEKAIKRLYSLKRETSRSYQQTTKEECSDTVVTSADNNEDSVVVSFDDRSVLDDIPDNSEHQNISNTQGITADTPRTPENAPIVDVVVSFDDQSVLGDISDNSEHEHPDVSNTSCLIEETPTTTLNEENVPEDGIALANKKTENKNRLENVPSVNLLEISSLSTLSLVGIKTSKNYSQESVVVSFDDRSLFDNLPDSYEHSAASNTLSLTKDETVSTLNKEIVHEHVITGTENKNEDKKCHFNEKSGPSDSLLVSKSINLSAIPLNEVTKSETHFEEYVIVSFDDKNVLDNIPGNSEQADVLNTSSLTEDTLTFTLNDGNVEADEMASADKIIKDEKCLKYENTQPSVSLPECKNLRVSITPLAGITKSNNDTKETVAIVAFDDRPVQDNIPSNSEHVDVLNTRSLTEATPVSNSNEDKTQEDGKASADKITEDKNRFENGNSRSGPSVRMPECKSVNVSTVPLVGITKSENDSRERVAASSDGSSLIELGYIPDNTEHPDASQCITEVMSKSTLNVDKVQVNGVKSADKITEDKNCPDNCNSVPSVRLPELEFVNVAITQLDRITKQKTESQENVIESFDDRNVLDTPLNFEHPGMSTTSSLIEGTPKSSLNEGKNQENGLTSGDKITEDKNRLENENSLPVDLPKYKIVKSLALPIGRITKSETISKENVVVSSNDRSVVDNIHNNSDHPDVSNTSSLIRDTPTTTLNEENVQKDEKASADNTREDKKCLESGDTRPLASSDSVGVSDMHSVELSNSVSDSENLNFIKTKPEKDIVYTKIKKDNNVCNEFRLKSLISLTSIKSLEKVKNHGSRSDCEFSVYVRSTNVNEMPRLIQVRASNKQVQDGIAKNFIKLRKDISEPLQFFDSLPDDNKKTKMRLQTCSSLIERNTAVQWTEKKGPSANAQLTTVPEFHMPAPKLKTVRELLGLDKLQKYGIIPQCQEIERIKLDEDEFPAILPPKIRRKWTQKKNEKKFVN